MSDQPRAEQPVIAVSRALEPSLTVRRRARWFLRSRFLRSFAVAASLALGGVVTLFPANLALPFEQLVTLNGSMGAQHSFFNDERLRELLLRHHIRVNVIRQGSIGAVTGDLDSLDFVLTSGDPAAQFLLER
ncbi:MAG: hypothetical protein ACRDTF_11450, partial [Pseudonocardiaceae bacterium]